MTNTDDILRKYGVMSMARGVSVIRWFGVSGLGQQRGVR